MYESETWRAMEKIASKRSAKLAQFEALVDVWKQQQQIQDVIATRRYLISDAQVAPVGDR